MIATVPKWKVTVEFTHPHKAFDSTIYISDSHIANVLQKVASIQFAPDSLVMPTRITVELHEGHVSLQAVSGLYNQEQHRQYVAQSNRAEVWGPETQKVS